MEFEKNNLMRLFEKMKPQKTKKSIFNEKELMIKRIKFLSNSTKEFSLPP